MDARATVQFLLAQKFPLVSWPTIGDTKGPREKDWHKHPKTVLEDIPEGHRVGVLLGTEIAEGHYSVDVDLDWAPGYKIALAMLPATGFVYGREGKPISHCFYTTNEPLTSFRYEDIDKTCLIELRGTKLNGDIGLQTMVPPSVWSKGNQREPLTFVRHEAPTHYEHTMVKQRTCLAAIGQILARHLGTNGFGHEPRLAFAGYLLRLGIPPEDVITMGEAISVYCNNTEVVDVRRSVESTVQGLATDQKKVKGGPALAKIIGRVGKQVINRINEWVGRDSDFVRDQNGVIIAKHQDNIKRAIDLIGDELSFNEFSHKLLYNTKPLEDREITTLYLRIDTDYRFQPPFDYFKMVVQKLAWENSFHPVKQYLESLTWDGEPRVDQWIIKSGHAEDTHYVRAVSAIMLIAAVKRIRHPGCKYDEMVVFESPQGGDKSSAAQALCPDPNWFSDDLRLNLHSQQLIEATLGKWIVEASDLSGKRKTEIETLKSMLSRQVDGPARMAYQHFAVERPRHFILIGTTNQAVYLNDPTGGRRFWPMKVKRFNVKWLQENRDQLWAEACVREAKGESIRLPESLWPAAAEQQEHRREIDPWEHIIRQAVIHTTPSKDSKRRVTTSVLWNALSIPIERRDRQGALRISDVMHRLGFERTRVRLPGEDPQVGYMQEDMTKLVIEDGELREREPGDDDEPF